MNVVFMPGCGVNREYKNEVNKTMEYLRRHYENVELHESCCKSNAEKPKTDLFIYSCFGCYPRMKDVNIATEYKSIYEVFDQFGLPVEAKESNKDIILGIHECSKLKEDQVNKDLIRKLVIELGYQIEESQVISDDYDKCGKVYLLNSDNDVEGLESTLVEYKTDNIVTVCKGCKAAIDQTSKKGIHLFEQIYK